MIKNKLVHFSIISIFVSLYLLVATISMINSVDFFNISHNGILSWSLAIGFELGAAASLAAIIILDKTNKTMVWSLFILLTAFQMMANSYHAFINLENYIGWIELFGLENEEPIIQKRILSIVSGAVLPIVALGFIKSLTDYITPPTNEDITNKKELDSRDDTETESEADAELKTEDNTEAELKTKENNNLIEDIHNKSYTNSDSNQNSQKSLPKDTIKETTKQKTSQKREAVSGSTNTETIKNKDQANGQSIGNTNINDTTVKAKPQGKRPSLAKDFNRADGMPLKGRQRTGDYV